MRSKKLEKEGIIIVDRKPFKYIKTVYDSMEPPEISHKEALRILNSQEDWEKLNLGEKLNVAKVYSYGIAGELDIKTPSILLVQFKDPLTKIVIGGCALSIKDGVFLNISKMKNAENVREVIAHEMKHIHQFYAIDSDYNPQTLPSEEIVKCWRESFSKNPDGTYRRAKGISYLSSLAENDASNFEYDYPDKIFGRKDKESVLKELGKFAAWRAIREETNFYRNSLKRLFTPEETAEVLRELKEDPFVFDKSIEKLQKELKKEFPNLRV